MTSHLRAALRAALTLTAIATCCAPPLTPAARAEELAYDLLHNLAHAHRYAEGVVVDLNDLSAVKHLRDYPRRWIYGVSADGQAGAVPQSVQADVWVHVNKQMATRPLSLSVTLKPAFEKQVMDVFVNGQKLANHNFTDASWQSVQVNVPKGTATEGIAHLRFHFRTSKKTIKEGVEGPAIISAVRLARAETPALPATKDAAALWPRAVKGAIELPKKSGLDYYVVVPADGALSLKVSEGKVNVWAQADGEAAKIVQKGISGEATVSLKAWAGAPARLMLRSPSGKAIVQRGSLSGASPFEGAPATAALKAPKYVVFWLIDTLRADKLPFYETPNTNGRPKVKTPNLSALAAEGTVFEPFYVQGNESKASHASLFTSVYPIRHKVYTHEANLPDPLLTIAELLKERGYFTGGYVSNGYVSDKWHFDQGFMQFENFIRENKANNAQAVVKSATAFIKEKKGSPFYLYLGTSDPHVTYRAHKEFISTYDTGPAYKGRYEKNITGEELAKVKEAKSPPSERDRKRIEAIYENEIAFNDKHFGALIKVLKAEGIYDETMIIVSADHGEEFWEHGSCGHGHSVYEELISVPLFIRWPAGFPAGRFEAGAEGVDLLPTLIDVFGAPKGAFASQGRSLLPQLSAKRGYPQARMASQATDRFAFTVGDAKLVFKGRGAIEAYDLKADGGELKDVSTTRPVLTLSVLDPMSIYLMRPTTWSKSAWGAPNALKEPFPEDFPKVWRKAPKGKR
jgi:choline-sulfatase